MTRARRLQRPRTIAATFGAYIAAVIGLAWFLVRTGGIPPIDPTLGRWIAFAYLVAASVFLVGLGLLAFRIQNAFEGRVREANRRLGSLVWDGGTSFEYDDVVAAQEGGRPTDRGDEELVEILESLGEAQSQAFLEPSGAEAPDIVELAEDATTQRILLQRRRALKEHEEFLTRFLPGPMVVSAAFIGVSALMLLGPDAMPGLLLGLDAVLVLVLAFGWPGLAGYFGASILAVIGSMRTERRVRKR